MRVGVDLDRAHVHEVADLDKDAVLLDIAQPFGDGGQETGALEDHVRALAARRVAAAPAPCAPPHRGTSSMSIVTSAPSRLASSSRSAGPPITIELRRAAELGATSVISPMAPDPCTMTVSPICTLARMTVCTATVKGSASTATCGGAVGLDEAVLRVGQVDVVGKAAAEGRVLGGDGAKAVGDAAVARVEDDPVALLDRVAQVVGR